MSDEVNAQTEPSNEPKLTVEHDGKQVKITAQAARDLLAAQTASTQASQKASAVLRVAEKYGLSPDEFATNAEATFALVTDLVERGVLNEKGELVEKKATTGTPIIQPQPSQVSAVSRVDDAVAAALGQLQKQNEALMNQLVDLRRDNTHLIRLRVQDEIRSKYPDLDSEDIPRVLAVASQAKDKTVFEIAEDLQNRKRTYLAEMRKKHAEEFGINLDEHDLNRQMIQSGGGAAVMTKGKKLSFRPGKDGMSPKEAMRVFLQNQKG